MQFKNIALFLAGASAVVAQSASTVVSDLQSIQSQTEALTTQLNNFDGTVQGGIPILSATTKLKSATAKAISDANAVSSASSADQASILKAAESLYPAIIASLQAFVKDIPKFKSAGISSVSESSLAQLKSQSATLGNALASKATGDFKSAATQINSAIAAAFSSAQAGTSPQSMQLPAIPSGGSSGGASSAASSAAATSKAAATSAKASTYAASSMAAMSTPVASTPVATPVASSVASVAPIATSAAPAPAYTGAAGKHVANVGGAVLLAAAAFAL